MEGFSRKSGSSARGFRPRGNFDGAYIVLLLNDVVRRCFTGVRSTVERRCTTRFYTGVRLTVTSSVSRHVSYG